MQSNFNDTLHQQECNSVDTPLIRVINTQCRQSSAETKTTTRNSSVAANPRGLAVKINVHINVICDEKCRLRKAPPSLKRSTGRTREAAPLAGSNNTISDRPKFTALRRPCREDARSSAVRSSGSRATSSHYTVMACSCSVLTGRQRIYTDRRSFWKGRRQR